MSPSAAAITAAWNVWQLNGGKENPMNTSDMGEIIRAAFTRMETDGYVLVRPVEEDPPRKITERFLESVQFQGVTRTLGVEQGFQPLYIADLMIPMDADGERVQPMMASIWEISPVDLPLLAKGHGIQFTMYGKDHPPMKLQVTAEPLNVDALAGSDDDSDYTGQNDG